MPELQPLREDHAPAVLAFERMNRSYFAASITDRGDEYFQDFTARHTALLAEQASGVGAYYVLVADDGSVMGRFNLFLDGDGTANLGYRVAESVAGQGVATTAVRALCKLAAEQHGVRTVRAATTGANVASQKVLLKAGFVAVGPAKPEQLGGKTGTSYRRNLTVRTTRPMVQGDERRSRRRAVRPGMGDGRE
jgi:ribosomal-protein-alanine N-acetyltransferase